MYKGTDNKCGEKKLNIKVNNNVNFTSVNVVFELCISMDLNIQYSLVLLLTMEDTKYIRCGFFKRSYKKNSSPNNTGELIFQ